MRIPSKQSIDPEALRKDPNAVRTLLQNPEAHTLLKSLQSKDSGELQAAARSALNGDTRALSFLMKDLSRNPEVSKAMENLNRKNT